MRYALVGAGAIAAFIAGVIGWVEYTQRKVWK